VIPDVVSNDTDLKEPALFHPGFSGPFQIEFPGPDRNGTLRYYRWVMMLLNANKTDAMDRSRAGRNTTSKPAKTIPSVGL